MKNTFGNNLTVTLFGESHGNAVGAVIDGIAPGISVDEEYIKKLLSLRRPVGDISTPRKEQDEFVIESGVFNGFTTGTPICVIIENKDTRSSDYGETRYKARPSHADYTAYCKYHGFEDYRGGGHFSGRLTAAIVAVGGIIIPALEKKGIRIATHIKRCGGISDRGFADDISKDIDKLSGASFAVLDEAAGEKMIQAIKEARSNGDSVGGVLETVITGIAAGVGEPWFDTVEGMLSHAIFSIPAVKGIEFGVGFALSDMKGSEANDPFYIEENEIRTVSNNSGGINGGLTNGMPIIFSTAFRPTPTITLEQNTVDFYNCENTLLESKGRHDPCIVHRARAVVDAMAAITVADMLITRYGTDYLSDRT